MTTFQPLPRRDRSRLYAVGLLPAFSIEKIANVHCFNYFEPGVDLRTHRHDGCVLGCLECRKPEAVVYLTGDPQSQRVQADAAQEWAKRTGIHLGWMAGDNDGAQQTGGMPMLRAALDVAAWHPAAVLLVAEAVLNDPNRAAELREDVLASGARLEVIPTQEVA